MRGSRSVFVLSLISGMTLFVFCEHSILERSNATHKRGYSTNTHPARRKVAFLAYYSKYKVNLGDHEAVKYDQVIENIGHGYNPFTGIFTAPVRGIYSISVSMMSDASNYMKLAIMKNRQLLTTLFANVKTFPQASNTINLSLRRGDTIWIQRRSGRLLHAHKHERYNTFSGVLISRV